MSSFWRVAAATSLVISCSEQRAPAVAEKVQDHSGGVEESSVIRVRTFDEPGAALAAVLAESRPTVLGLGERHEVVGGAPVKSALERFGDDLLPVLKGVASDLVLETWVEDPSCNRKAEAVRAEVKGAIARPRRTESVLLRTMARAKRLGIRNHGLVMGCEHYESLRDSGGGVDYAKLLSLVTEGLKGRALTISRRADAKLVVLYGGALHNDIAPNPGVAQWSYAGDVAAQTARYVEVDLYVPEYIATDPVLAKEPWFSQVELQGSPAGEKVQLIERGDNSYVMILRRDIKVAAVNTGSGITP